MASTIPASTLRNPVHLLALGFGSGLSPRAPGTAGTAVAVLLWWLFSTVATPSLTLQLIVVAVASVAGIYLCGRTARDLGVHDHGAIVWDEFAGFWLAMLAVPVTPAWLLAAFVLFRLFDIVKPWPIRQIDRKVGGGFGIVLDDLLAGVYTLAILHLVRWGLS